jgi:hypothetical protein
MAKLLGFSRGRISQLILAVFFLGVAAEAPSVTAALHLTDPIAVDPPRLTTNAGVRFGAKLATGLKTTLFGWGELRAVPGSDTNLLVVAVDHSGQMLDPGGKVAAVQQYAGGLGDLIPSGEDFFVVYARKQVQNSSGGEWLFARLNADGVTAIPPRVFGTNVGARTAASNGDTFLNVWSTNISVGLDYTLYTHDAEAIVSARLPSQPFQTFPYGGVMSASAGGNYLLLWPYRGITAAIINGTTGAFTTNSFSTNQLVLRSLASNGSEYLLVGYAGNAPEVTKLFRMSANGSILSEGAITNAMRVPLTIIANGDHWYVFEPVNSNELTSYTVRSVGNLLTIDAGPFPSIEGSAIARLHGDRFIVAGRGPFGPSVGYRIISSHESTEQRFPLARVQQVHTGVATSPFGYLVTWQEMDGTSSNILGRRFKRDGSIVDSAPFKISAGAANGVIRLNYEQSHYRVVWQNYFRFATSDVVLGALIDAEGPPNVRTNKVTISSPSWPTKPLIEITPYRDTSIVFQRQRGQTYQSYEVGPLGSAIMQESVWFAGRGNELFKAVSAQFNTRVIAGRAPSVFGALTETNDFGPGTSPIAIALTNTFFLAWRNQAGALASALIQDGTVLQTNVLMSQTTTNLSIAGNDHQAVVSVLANGLDLRTTNTFVLFDDQTRAAATLQRTFDYGTNGAISIAPLGKDFIVSSSLWNGRSAYAAIQILTETPLTASATATISANQITLTFRGLDPQRTYEIQSSPDLLTWQTVGVISGNSTQNYNATPEGAGMFFRLRRLPD